MWIANFWAGILIILLGLSIKKFKLSFLISGYNASSKEEKETYDKDKLTKYVGNRLIISASVILLPAIISLFTSIPKSFLNISWTLYTITLLIGVIYINTGNRVKKTNTL